MKATTTTAAMNELFKVECWEVYERDSQISVAYLTEEQARNSTFFDEIDLITPAVINMTKEDLEHMKMGFPFY